MKIVSDVNRRGTPRAQSGPLAPDVAPWDSVNTTDSAQHPRFRYGEMGTDRDAWLPLSHSHLLGL